MSSKRRIRLTVLCLAGIMTLSTLPFALRAYWPGLLGTHGCQLDVLNTACYLVAYLRAMAVYGCVVLIPTTLLIAWRVPATTPRQQSFRTFLKISGAVVLVAWVCSFFITLRYNAEVDYMLEFERGVLRAQWGQASRNTGFDCGVTSYSPYLSSAKGVSCEFQYPLYNYHYAYRLPDDLRQWAIPYFGRNMSPRCLELPVWPLAAPLVALGYVLWRRDRRRRSLGLCVTCGYELTGNVSGVCPECGTSLNEPTPSAS